MKWSTLLPLGMVAFLTSCGEKTAKTKVVNAFAAASLSDVLTELATVASAECGIQVEFNFAGSNVLARQIESASHADVFISADEQWISYLEERNRLRPDTKQVILANSLALITSKDFDEPFTDPAGLCGAEFRWLVVANPEAVPAGRYAKAWLESIDCNGTNLWKVTSRKISPAPNVRAALGQVESIPNCVGIVYYTDYLHATNRVRLIYHVKDDDSPAVHYFAAATVESNDAAATFLKFLRTESATRVFVKHGFLTNPPRP